MDNNKVTVKIFGQEYTIMGSKAREHIIKVADYVDVKMKEISQALNSGPLSSIAVLSAVNIADDYFSALERFQHLEVTNAQAEKDTEHYVQLWEEAKKSHIQQQEEIKELNNQKSELKDSFENQLTDLQQLMEEKDAEIKKLKEDSAKAEVQLMESSSDMVNELEAKYKDLESSFFDIQMENIQLKGELDRYKKKME
ncbi:cell division protein ZapA [Aminipila luticellarii]|uniref:Cell division protein ZapA n=1 Tax=Aminipila luticellarii TaxID=2507160 RepID=A0A410PWH0_9FIRM|nr:cell division protein ZapA [Aminipila luticellarii]QAT43298.1 cell division protein ZapA [Aminipila luticellarii]